MSVSMEKIVALCKGRGYVYAGSEIYGGLANSWDYGPLGVELKNNLKKAWWKKFVQENPHNIGLDSSILLNSSVWQASGHVVNFNDPLIDCKGCKMRHRADHLIEAYAAKKKLDIKPEGMENEEMIAIINDKGINCPHCGKHDFTSIRKFNMMFKTHQGVTEESKTELYLRPETAQGIFVNFQNIKRTTRRKIPFGVAQTGSTFRNEITPGNFIFRTREFEQMELEFFCKPGTDLEWFDYWKQYCYDFLIELGINAENLRMRDHSESELSHYSKATTDFEYKFPFGWGELWGIADRTDFDLKSHQEASGQSMTVAEEGEEPYIPYVIEPSLGVGRLLLVALIDAYDEEVIDEKDTRIVLRLHHTLAPYKAAILPLSKKLADECAPIYEQLCKHFMCDYDETGSIGKRYRRQDEVGTPYCVTIDFDTAQDNAATVRERDSMKQERIAIDKLVEYLTEKLFY